jgi:hypothetical protein
VFHKAIKRFWFSSNQLSREFNFVVTFQGPYDLIVAGLTVNYTRARSPALTATSIVGPPKSVL